MAVAMFYHQTRSPVEETVGLLSARALQRGWRVMVRSPDAARLAGLDTRLWQEEAASFLPHGLAGGVHDRDQPILLGSGVISNAAQGVMLLDRAEVENNEAGVLERIWVIFDGGDEAAVAHARAQWSELTKAGHAAEYWSEESGKWEKKAESKG